MLVVVKIRQLSGREGGRYEAILSVRSATLDDDGSAKESVEGSERPGKVDRRMLTFWDAMVIASIADNVKKTASNVSISRIAEVIDTGSRWRRCLT